MAISVNAVTHVITVPLADLTLVQAGLYDFDTAQFRLDLRAWEATEEGRAEPITHVHYPAYTIAGIQYGTAYRLTQDYSVEFEDGNYTVRLQNTNNNIFDIADGRLVKNNVLVIPNNSAGLQVITTGSGLDAAQDAKLTAIDLAVQIVQNLAEADETHTASEIVKKLKGTQTKLLRKNVTGSNLTGTLEIVEP